MQDTLVVFYSHTGTARRAAQLLASHRGWALGEVVDFGRRGTLRCVLDSLLGRRPRIVYRGPPPADFGTVVLVAPIWLLRLAGPMRSFVAEHRAELHRTAAILTLNGSSAGNAFAELARLLGHGLTATAALTQRAFDDGSATTQLLAFGTALAPPALADAGPHGQAA